MVRALVLAGLVVASCGGGSSTGDVRADQIRELASNAGLSKEVQDFLALAARATAASYRVTYAVTGDPPTTIEIRRRPPRSFVEIDVTQSGAHQLRRVITTPDGTVTCTRTGGRWSCARSKSTGTQPGVFGERELRGALDDLVRSKRDYTYRVSKRRVVGVDARCLVTELKPGRPTSAGLGQRGTLCIAPSGTPLIVETPSRSLKALRYSDDVPGDSFELPAPLSG